MLTGLRIPCSDLSGIYILGRMGHKCIFNFGFMLVLSVLLVYYVFRNANNFLNWKEDEQEYSVNGKKIFIK